MSFLSMIAFVALVAVLIGLNVVKNRASAELHTKLHPPKKEQEEFLKTCELYLEYCEKPEEHPEPEADAKYDAAVSVRMEGFLPMAWERLPVQNAGKGKRKVDYKSFLRSDGEPEYVTYDAIRNMSRDVFLKCRKQDQLLSGYSQDPRFWKEGTFNNGAWETYCGEMDAAFSQLEERFRKDG
jgi:hypothetical protein